MLLEFQQEPCAWKCARRKSAQEDRIQKACAEHLIRSAVRGAENARAEEFYMYYVAHMQNREWFPEDSSYHFESMLVSAAQCFRTVGQ